MEHNALWSSLRARLAGWKPPHRLFAGTPTIGFDLASERLNLAQLGHRGKASGWHAVASVPYPQARTALLQDVAGFRSFVRDALRQHGFRGRRVVSVLPPGDLQVISMDYTTPNGQDDTAILLRTLKERFKGGLEDSVVDILPIRRPPESNLRSAVVAVAPRERVLAHLNLLQSAGLAPQAIDIGPAALARVARAVVVDPPRANLLLLNFGTRKSYMTLLWGRRLMFDRQADFGEQSLADTLARNLDLSPERALALLRKHGLQSHGDEVGATISELLQPDFQHLAHEVNRVLIYFASQTHGGSVESIYICGSIARHPGAAEFMGRLLTMPVQVLNPWCMPDSPSTAIAEPPAGMAVAAGLALRSAPRHVGN